MRALTSSLANSESRNGERYKRRTLKVVSRLLSLYRTMHATSHWS